MTAPETDPLADVKVGDPTPDECRVAVIGTSSGCGAPSDYWCTRNAGHPGQHIATDGREVVEVWAGESPSSAPLPRLEVGPPQRALDLGHAPVFSPGPGGPKGAQVWACPCGRTAIEKDGHVWGEAAREQCDRPEAGR